MSRVTIVPEGKLFIERGTLVLTAPGSAILARGLLNSYGDSQDFVKFRPGVPQAGWGGIELETGVKHLVERFDIRGANHGLCFSGEPSSRTAAKIEIRDCLILANKLGAETK